MPPAQPLLVVWKGLIDFENEGVKQVLPNVFYAVFGSIFAMYFVVSTQIEGKAPRGTVTCVSR